jgi:hypothetical protein
MPGRNETWRVVLRRYWFEFAHEDAPVGVTNGCGVTAFDAEDALRLVGHLLGTDPPTPTAVMEDVDVSTLDALHVLPNMLPPHERGVWYPLHSYR